MKVFDRRSEPKSRRKMLGGLPIRNETGASIAAGKLLYVSSWSETYKRFLVTLADADVSGRSNALFITRVAIANNQNGVGRKTLRLQSLNTSAASSAGDPVYLSATAGGWTLTAPAAAGGVNQIVGRVAVDDAVVGEIEFNLDLNTADASAQASFLAGLRIEGVTGGTDGAVIRAGTSGSPLTDDQAGAGFIVGYFDSGATSGWPAGLFVSTNVTAAGGSFTALQGDAVLTAAKGVVTGVENWMQLNTGGRVTGACRSIQGTLDFSNEDKGSGGVYSAATFNIKGEGSSCDVGDFQRVHCLELKTEGTFGATSKSFQTKGTGIYINGFTAGAIGQVLTNASLTWNSAIGSVLGLKVGVGGDAAEGAVYYIPLIPTAEWD